MKVGADIGEAAEHEEAFDEGHGDHGARPGRAQHGEIVDDESARAGGGGVTGARDRIAQKFDHQRDGGERKKRGEEKEHAPPAEQIAEHAAGGLAEQLAEDLARQKGAEHLLPPLVGNDVAEEGESERDDPAGREPAGEPRRDQHRQGGRKPAEQHQHRGGGAGRDDAGIFAEAVADRADDKLHRAVRQRIGGDHDRGRADAYAHVGRDLRQERIGDPHHRLAGKRCDRQERDGGGGAAA